MSDSTDLPIWIPNLLSGDNLVVYFPKKSSIFLAEVLDNLVPTTQNVDEHEVNSILVVNYKVNNFVIKRNLLYSDYANQDAGKNDCWRAYQLM